MRHEQEAAASDDGKAIRRKARGQLPNGSQLAGSGASARGREKNIANRGLLGNPGNCAKHGKAQAGAEAKKQESKGAAIDPLALPYVMMSERNYLPTCSGIYFAIEESGEVAYIGQSINIWQRWRAHHVQGDLCDLSDLQSARRVRFAWLQVERAELDRVEVELIRRFRPRLNATHVPVEPKPKLAMDAAELNGGMKLLSTEEAAQRLGVSTRRVRALIAEGKIKAHQLGRDYAIEEDALASVKVYGKAGRPPRAKESTKKAKIKQK